VVARIHYRTTLIPVNVEFYRAVGYSDVGGVDVRIADARMATVIFGMVDSQKGKRRSWRGFVRSTLRDAAVEVPPAQEAEMGRCRTSTSRASASFGPAMDVTAPIDARVACRSRSQQRPSNRGVVFLHVHVIARPLRRTVNSFVTRAANSLKGVETASTRRVAASAVATALMGMHHVN